jgi:alcohol dehydrogenase, propanol-preferring
VLAAQLNGYKEDFVLEDVVQPEPPPGGALIRIAGAGVCHSDLHLQSGELPMLPSLPWILGHENAGYVEALGPGASGFDLGEPVAIYGGWGCGRCRFCLGGQEQMCDVMKWVGIGCPGGYAEYLAVPATRHLVPIGDLDPVTAAPLVDAALTPYRAVMMARPRLRPGTVAVSIGVGGLGQYGLRFLHELTAARVIAVDTDPQKREVAESLGIDLVLDPTEVDVVEEVRTFTGGEGATAVIDYVGAESTLATAAGTVGRQGLVVVVGLAGGSLPFSFLGLAGEAEVTSSQWGTRNELGEVIALAQQGRIPVAADVHPLMKINEVFGRLERGEIEHRAVLVP